MARRTREQLVLPNPSGGTQPAPAPSHRRLVHRQAAAAETAPTGVDPEELLILDARARVTPAQMVDTRLRALLESSQTGGDGRATKRRGDFRRPACCSGLPLSPNSPEAGPE